MKRSLNDLFQHEIKDLYSAETQLIEALPKMAKAASHESLQEAFENHLAETRQQQQRLVKVAEHLGFDPKGETCNAMEGLIEEGEEMVEMDAESDVKDAGLIAAAQRVEHYEIAGYGTAVTFAQMLGHREAEQLLQETLKEEKHADGKLNKLAESKINRDAMS